MILCNSIPIYNISQFESCIPDIWTNETVCQICKELFFWKQQHNNNNNRQNTTQRNKQKLI